MNLFSRNRNVLPLTPVDRVVFGKRIVTEAMNLITELTTAGQGGLIAIMRTKKDGLYAVQLDRLSGYRPAQTYTSSYLNERIHDTLRIISHAWNNPEPYALKDVFTGKKDKLAMIAMATPIDFEGKVTQDTKAFGWEVVAGTASGVEIDFLIFEGSIVGGSTSFDLGRIFKSEEVPELEYGSRPVGKMGAVFNALSSEVPPAEELFGKQFAV